MDIDLNTKYRITDDVVAREIEGELIIVPLTSGIGDLEDELFTLNETGRSIWAKLDGSHTLKQVIESLNQDFQDSSGSVEGDVVGFVKELIRMKMVITASDE
ncbi:PqqD family protein [bacterium]|nr:PqqD family protein [bacterium]